MTKCHYGKEAISKLKDEGNRYDIVIMDVNMPDIDGFELLKRIKLEMDLPVISNNFLFYPQSILILFFRFAEHEFEICK